MDPRRSFGAALTIASLALSAFGCSRDLPTSTAGSLYPVSGGPAQPPAGGAEGPRRAVAILVPRAIASIRHFPELGILDGGGIDGDAQSTYFRTTETNREFRRGFAEFAVPDFSGGFLSAKLVLRETRASIAAPVPPDRHELSSYSDVDLNVTTRDFDRPTSPLAAFETDPNLDPQTFEFDVSSLVAQSQRAGLGFRVKLEDDPGFTGFVPRGTAFSGSSTPPGVTLEVTTTLPAAIDHLEDVIQRMHLSRSLEARLLAPLEEAARVLRDENPNNDGAACGQLGAFLRELDAAARSGVVDPQAVSDLEQLALSIRSGAGCPESPA